jgi:hypothetical protein
MTYSDKEEWIADGARTRTVNNPMAMEMFPGPAFAQSMTYVMVAGNAARHLCRNYTECLQ